ncbi:MAG: acetyl-CoA carboxylase biotin carboxyl carrier protein subunit, partial [Sphingobacteriales bacterium]
MYQVKVNGRHNYAIDKVDGDILINGSLVNADVKPLARNSYHIINNNRSYTIEVVSFD